MQDRCATTARPTRTSQFQLRAFVSLLLILSGVLVIGSGLVVLFAPSGRAALLTGWSALGIGRQGWVALHDIFGLLWIPLLGVHVVLNRKPILCYLKDRARKSYSVRKETVAALAVTVVLVLLTLSRVPPLATLIALGHQGAGR
ncbi:MAG: DUF4405 domain-containing protein [Deinococcales bacterium]